MRLWVQRAWAVDWVRGPALFLYYLAIIYAMLRMYGSGLRQAVVPFVYQGF